MPIITQPAPMPRSLLFHKLHYLAVMALAVASTFISLIAHAAEPFIGAYTEFPMLFNEKDSPQEREHSMAEQLNRFQDAGLRVVIPLVVTGQNVAFYPTKLIPSRAYQDWDPLAKS